MGTCCTTRDKSITSDLPSKGGDASNKNEVQKSLDFITRYLDQNREAQILALCYSKDQLQNFKSQLSQIMSIIKTKTGHVFVPVALQNSPLNPEKEMIIIMRSVNRNDKYNIDREEKLDETKLAKQFITRSFQFMTNGDPSERKNQLKNDLLTSYKNDGLMIIGGIQDPGKVNNLHMLLYKTEQNRVGNQGENASYYINVEMKLSLTTGRDFENGLNQAQIDYDSQLRAIISFEDTYQRQHFIIYQEQNVDRLYTTQTYPVNILDETTSRQQFGQMNSPSGASGRHSKSPSTASQAAKQQQIQLQQTPIQLDTQTLFSEKLSNYLNSQERKLNGCLVESITNTKLEDSYLVFSS